MSTETKYTDIQDLMNSFVNVGSTGLKRCEIYWGDSFVGFLEVDSNNYVSFGYPRTTTIGQYWSELQIYNFVELIKNPITTL